MPKSNEYKDLSGQRYHSLLVTSIAPPRFDSRGWKIYCWNVQCDCGKAFVCTGASLKSGSTKRCWECRNNKISADQMRHGHARKRGGHTREYSSWLHAKNRCFNPNNDKYEYYGGRGITMCDRWNESFDLFLADMGPAPTQLHTLDRWPDINGNYEPGNCRWATRKQQSANRRIIVLYSWAGADRTMADIAKMADVDAQALSRRLKAGIDIVAAVLELQAMPRLERCKRPKVERVVFTG